MGLARHLCPFVTAVAVLACWLVTGPALYAQGALCTQPAGAPLPSYAVTSVKKDVNGDSNKPVRSNQTADGLYISNETLGLMIREAYGVRSYQIIGSPAWVNEREWQVEAKMDDAEAEKLKSMNKADAERERCQLLQSLLADRFKLVTHHDTRIERGLALVVAKGGPKFHEATLNPPGQQPKPPITMDNGTLAFNGYPIDRLALMLSQVIGKPVVDKTGLTGKYEFTIPWAESEFVITPDKAADNTMSNGESGVSIFTVLRDRLGLRLQSEKIPADVIVIDHIEEPLPN